MNDLFLDFLLGVKMGQKSGGGGDTHLKVAPMSISFGNSTDTAIDLNYLNSVNLKNYSGMFSSCRSLTYMDVSPLSDGNPTSVSVMFSNCSAIENIDGLDTLNYTKVTSFNNMFDGCSKLKEVIIHNLVGTSSITWTWGFNNCKAIEKIVVDNYIGTIGTRSFSYCNALKFLDIRKATIPTGITGINPFLDVPADCLIIVKDDTTRNNIKTYRNDFTNIVTVEEYVNS